MTGIVPLGIDAIRLFEAERLLVSFRRQKNVLSESSENQYTAYTGETDARWMQ